MKRSKIGENDVNMADIMMLISRSIDDQSSMQPQTYDRMFECKTCNRQFPSFQALGGHRASHKKSKLLGNHDGSAQKQVQTKPKTHECSICGAEFPIGQALGGHMRRHRGIVGDGMLSLASGDHVYKKKVSSGGSGGGGGDGGDDKKIWGFDLNMTPPLENDADVRLLTFTLGLPVMGSSIIY